MINVLILSYITIIFKSFAVFLYKSEIKLQNNDASDLSEKRTQLYTGYRAVNCRGAETEVCHERVRL